MSDMVYNFKGKKILVAEDDLSNFELVRIILNTAGAEVIHARHGAEAIALVEQHSFHLIIMDIQMPVLNGLEAIKVIKAKQPNVPIIAQTAYAMTGDRERIMGTGCDEYIPKPINKKAMLHIIDKILKKQDS